MDEPYSLAVALGLDGSWEDGEFLEAVKEASERGEKGGCILAKERTG